MDEAARPRVAAARLLEWLARHDEQQPGDGTSPEALAALLGLDVAFFHPSARRAETLGWLEPGESLIYLREGLPEAVRRFTLAHEIGHAVLHRAGGLEVLTTAGMPVVPFADLAGDAGEGPDCDGDDLDAPVDVALDTDETLRTGQAYSARARREAEANAFAAQLLLPAEKLIPAYLTLAQREGRSNTHELADRFGVTEEVLLQRLSSLLTATGRESGEALEVETQVASGGWAGELELSQREAAEAEAPALIVAGPGTGKTSTLVARVGFLVHERSVHADRILALTFSNKAAREMRERLERLLGADDSTGDMLVAVRRPVVSTIHAFCGDLVRRYAPLVGLRPDFRLLSEADSYLVLRQVAGNLALSHYQSLAAPALHFPTLLAAISRAKDELAGAERYEAAVRAMSERAQSAEERHAAERALEVAAVYGAYQRAIEARGDADFGDVILLAVRLLQQQPEVLEEVRTQYQHVLVDEFQDINRAMGILLHTLAGSNGPMWAVGDADQAIYRFRGASPANLTRFTQDYPTAHVHTLHRNFRSVPVILEAATALASTYLDSTERNALVAEREQPEGAAITLAAAPDEAAEMAGVVMAIRERTAAGRMLSDQAVLCRTRRQCQRVAAALIDAGIATRLAAPLFEQDDVKDVLAVLALAAEPSGTGLLRAGNLSDHAFSQSDARLLLGEARARHVTPDALLMSGLDDLEGISTESRRGLRRIAAIIGELRGAPDVAIGMAGYLFRLTTLGRRLLEGIGLADEAAAIQAAHLAQLQALAHTFEEARHAERLARGQASRRRRETADWAAFLDYIRVVTILRQEPGAAAEDLLGDGRDGVRVLTVHASKGLEFPVVYLPGLADRRFPMQRRADLAPRPPGLSEDDDAERRDPNAHLAEEACLFYVALTRARDALVLSYAERYGRVRYRPSPFLLPVERQLGERLARADWRERAASAGGEEVKDEPAPATGDGTVVPALEHSAPIRPAAIETYHRCPRQYAYRYVYGLSPREVGMATLRRALHDTLRTLDGGDARNGRNGASRPGAATRQEAIALFEQHWQSALRQERAGEDQSSAASSSYSDSPFVELYHRHGRHVVERLWEALEARRGEQANGRPPADVLAMSGHYEHPVTVQVGARQIEVTLDRIEYEPGQAVQPARRSAARGTHSGPQPVRFVRHRLGRPGSVSPDLRTLLYTLAAERETGSPELYQHNLSTGEQVRVVLDDRRLRKLYDELAEVLDGMESGVYPARPDPTLCQSCPFLLICPA